MIPLPRTAKIGVKPDKDIEGHTRAMHRYLKTGKLGEFDRQREIVKRTFGIGKRTLAKKAAKKAGLPQYGVVGPALYKKMWDAEAYDAKARDLLEEYADSLKPKLVEPKQGWSSLHPSLWKAYSKGRRRGFHDLGTYNPASRLPSGGKSDHAYYPAYAFDLGIDPDTGWNHLKARAYCLELRLYRAVRYWILGDKIWSRGQLRAYRSGGHLNHIHVSGRSP